MSLSDVLGMAGLAATVIALVLSIYFYWRTTLAAHKLERQSDDIAVLVDQMRGLLQQYRDDLDAALQAATPRGLCIHKLRQALAGRRPLRAGEIGDAAATRGWTWLGDVHTALSDLRLDRVVAFDDPLTQDTIVTLRAAPG